MSDPEFIDRYEVKGVLGQGAMGHVYRAWDPKLHREVALKVVAKNLSKDVKGRQRFHREARAIAALKHPNIVEIYDYSGEESEHLYLVMEKLDGDDLFNIVNAKGIMTEAAAAAVGHELCLALQVAHEAGIIHRDLKPENVFMNANGRVVLTDFGVVKAIREDSAVDGWSSETDVIGTPGFMAPELMMNRALGPRTDIFALGALLYNITTGDLPFKGDSPVEMFRAVVSGKMQDPRQFNTTLSSEFIEIVEGCLDAKPKRRFRSAEQVRDRLKAVLEHNGVSDLRDDLRDYMRDPEAYAKLARRRTVGYCISKLKVAIKDKDEVSANRLRDRIAQLDPNNEEMHAISGVSMTAGGRLVVRSDAGRGKRTGASGGLLYVTVGVLAGFAVLVAVFLLMRQRTTPSPQADVELSKQLRGDAITGTPTAPNDGTPPVANVDPAQGTNDATKKLATARVEVAIKGGAGTIYVDGKRVGRGTNKSLQLAVGKHVIEVRGRGNKKLKQTVTVEANARTKVSVDLARGKISAD